MIATKLITASTVLFMAATSAAAFQPCTQTKSPNGLQHVMHPTSELHHFELAGFTVKMVSDGVYDLHSGPTKANKSVMTIGFVGVDGDRAYRYEFQNGQSCTANVPEGPVGSSMRAFVETF